MSLHGGGSDDALEGSIADLYLDTAPRNDHSSLIADDATTGSDRSAGCTAQTVSPETDLWQCAICLEDIKFANIAVIKGCEHTYCVHCILKWSSLRNDASCPTCKKPFANLLVHRQIDGTLTDFQVEESSTLLARSDWFQRWLKDHEQTRDLYKYATFRSAASAEVVLSPEALLQQEWAEDALCEFFDEEVEDDDEMEAYYLGRASTSHVTFGNRRWGANGYVKTGHRRAQPTQPKTPNSGGKVARGSCSTAKNTSHVHRSAAPEHEQHAPKAGASGGGRRARRKARRAEEDAFD